MCFSTDIPIDTMCPSLRPVPLFGRGRIQAGASDQKRRKARSFNFTFRYIDDVLLQRNSKYYDFVDRIYPIELEISRMPQIQLDLYHTLTYTSMLTMRKEVNSPTKEMVSIFPLRAFYICIASFQSHLHMMYASLLIRYSRVAILISLIEDYCHQGSYWTKGSHRNKLQPSPGESPTWLG